MRGVRRSWWLFLGLLAWWMLAAGWTGAQEVVEDEALLANPQIVLKTSQGEMVVELFPQHAPQTVGLFLQYAKNRRYNRLLFERYAQGFALQLAAPKMVEYVDIPDERKNGLSHVQGAVGIAWDYVHKRSGSKVYICLANAPQLDNKHTLIGRVTQGLELLLQLRPGDKLKTITISKPPQQASGQ